MKPTMSKLYLEYLQRKIQSKEINVKDALNEAYLTGHDDCFLLFEALSEKSKFRKPRTPGANKHRDK